MMNTRISYLYRDASNYKQYEEVIIKGEFYVHELMPLLEKSVGNGNCFIPSDLGLEDLQGRFASIDPTTPNNDDHIWHELESIELTNDSPTSQLSADDIRVKLAIVKENGLWDETQAQERLGYY